MIIVPIARDDLKRRCAPNVNPDSSFLVICDPGTWGNRCYVLSGKDSAIRPRLLEAVNYAEALFVRLRDPQLAKEITRFSHYGPKEILFQEEDCPENVLSASWESMTGWDNIALVPDLYYYRSGGYGDFMPPGSPDCLPWADRRPTLIWRGNSTGIRHLTPEQLPELLRYKLFLAARPLGGAADIGFTEIVQTDLEEARDAIVRQMNDAGAIKPYIPFEQMAAFKYIADVDGNANSWNFIKKLRLGCCILKLESPWRQWFGEDLVAWEHYVPVARDASDLPEKLDWCLSHDDEARLIAARGREFALNMDFELEMRKAAVRLASASGPVTATRSG